MSSRLRFQHPLILWKIFPWLFLLLALLSQMTAHAAEEEFLEPQIAFKFSARMADARTVAVTYAIADGYYMYRERFDFKAQGATLGQPAFPPGTIKFDDTFKKNVETYRKAVTITVPIETADTFTLQVVSQGCSDKGLCYAPMTSEERLSPNGLLAAVGALKDVIAPGISARDAGPPNTLIPTSNLNSTVADSETSRIESSLKSGRLVAILPLFFLLGLGLSFTPCVLPMVPILSSIIVGDGARVSRSRALILSAAYSLGMAVIYTALGIAAGLIGEGLAASLQNPWVLTVFALTLTVFSLSMFGVYQLQMPAFLQSKLAQASGKQSSGKLLGVFAMGAISALIVGPCVAAPLAGALLYISQTRDVVIGGSALFAMAAGMSIPLLLVGISGAILPRAGVWMDAVKQFFGVLLLAVALWMVSPVIPGWMQMAGWTALGLVYGVYMLREAKFRWPAKVLGLVFLGFGLIQLTGVVTGGRDALAPLAHLRSGHLEKTELVRVKTIADLEAILAGSPGKTVMLDFYADWCVSCIEMEKLTFSDSRVRMQFSNMLLVQADVTANDVDDKAMLRRFKLFGPPAIIFFDKQGREVAGGRVIGYQNADRFLQSLAAATQH